MRKPGNAEPSLIKLLEDVASTLRAICRHDQIDVVKQDFEDPPSSQVLTTDNSTGPYILMSGLSEIEIPRYKQIIQSFLINSVNLVTHESEIEIHWRNSIRLGIESDGDNELYPEIKNEGLFPFVELPEWLDILIFEEYGAIYQPDPISHAHNLENTEEKNLVYLGTYFPRSYAESFLLFRDIFLNRGFNEYYRDVNLLKLMDVGCGTAGEIIGFLHALSSVFEMPPKLEITIVDGNIKALDLANSIITHTCRLLDIQCDLHIHREVIIGSSDFETLNAFSRNLYDFVITSKFINELIASDPKRNINLYYDFLKIFSASLNQNGLICLIDVTTQSIGALYFPTLLNFQINEIEKNHHHLRTVIPLSCHSFGKECSESCFFGRVINLSHSRCSNDTTKIACRVVGFSDFVLPKLNTAGKANYYSPWINYKHQETELVCKKGISQKQKMDAFKI